MCAEHGLGRTRPGDANETRVFCRGQGFSLVFVNAKLDSRNGKWFAIMRRLGAPVARTAFNRDLESMTCHRSRPTCGNVHMAQEKRCAVGSYIIDVLTTCNGLLFGGSSYRSAILSQPPVGVLGSSCMNLFGGKEGDLTLGPIGGACTVRPRFLYSNGLPVPGF